MPVELAAREKHWERDRSVATIGEAPARTDVTKPLLAVIGARPGWREGRQATGACRNLLKAKRCEPKATSC